MRKITKEKRQEQAKCNHTIRVCGGEPHGIWGHVGIDCPKCGAGFVKANREMRKITMKLAGERYRLGRADGQRDMRQALRNAFLGIGGDVHVDEVPGVST